MRHKHQWKTINEHFLQCSICKKNHATNSWLTDLEEYEEE